MYLTVQILACFDEWFLLKFWDCLSFTKEKIKSPRYINKLIRYFLLVGCCGGNDFAERLSIHLHRLYPCLSFIYILKRESSVLKKSGKILLANMVDKGYFIGDSLLFTAITCGVIVVLGIFLLVVITWVCTEFICTENWRETWEIENSIHTPSIRAAGVQNVKAIQGKC